MPTTFPLILASTSTYRRELLERLRLPFLVRAPDCDEDGMKSSGCSPREVAEALALAKAESVQRQHPPSWVLGSDQVCTVDAAILGKPGSVEAAEAMLQGLQGQEHQLLTAVCLLGPQGQQSRSVDCTTLRMRRLTPEAIARYVGVDRPLDCAGAYKLESLGIALFESVDSDDHSAVTGLPLMAVTRMLTEVGFTIP